MDRRQAAAEATRQRIVEAAVALHAEKGALDTNWQDIAQLADVAVGTVYHHFPSLNDLLPACIGHGLRDHPPPPPEILKGVMEPAARMRCVVSAWFAWYEKAAPWLRWFRDTPDLHPVQRRLLEQGEARREALIREALGREASERVIRALVALTDYNVWRSLSAAGMSSQAAAELISEVLNTWLENVARRGDRRRQQRKSP